MTTSGVLDNLHAPEETQPAERTGSPRTPETTDVGLREVLGIWAGLGIVAVAVLTTYARFPVSEFYNVSISGFAGGLSRSLVFLNFPVAFIGLALMGFALARLYTIPGVLSKRERWLVGFIAALAVTLSLVAGVVVHQSDLDAKPANAIPAAGVLLALGLTLFAARRAGIGAAQPWQRSDTVRFVGIAILFVAALHWVLAVLGIYIGDIPLLGRIYMSKEVLPGHTLAAVHLGDHHGFDGVIFAMTAIILTRQLGRVSGALRWPLTVYVALMLIYGIANGIQDFWGEQIVKRGWADTEIPSMVVPKVMFGWGLILLGAVAVAIALHYMTRPHDDSRIPVIA